MSSKSDHLTRTLSSIVTVQPPRFSGASYIKSPAFLSLLLGFLSVLVSPCLPLLHGDSATANSTLSIDSHRHPRASSLLGARGVSGNEQVNRSDGSGA